MEGQKRIGARSQSELLRNIELLRPLSMLEKSIHHDVADEKNLLFRESFLQKILLGTGLSDKEIFGKMIGNDPVQLFRHRPIEAPKSSFNVRDRDSHFRRAQAGRDCGVHVTEHHDEIRFLLFEERLKADHDLAGLLAVGRRPHL